MESLCPLCAKSGIKRRIKAFQVNLEEAVWACEAEECSWPIGYEELMFFARSATSCNWEEPSPAKEDVPTLTELSLYTPPVTPGGELSKELTEIASAEYLSNPPAEDKGGMLPKGEFVASTRRSAGANESTLFEAFGLGDVSPVESKSLMNEQIAGVKMLPKIVNIEKANINLAIFSTIGEHCDNRKIQEYERSLTDTTVVDTFENLTSNGARAELGLSKRYTGGERNDRGKLQSDAAVNDVETNFGADALSETMKTLVDLEVANNLNTTSEPVANGDIDTLLESIFSNSETQIPLDINDDWLNLLMS